ncbi:unnamed protein product [Lymnaea stagnalis]|uniref:Uncharacterized protein n=1 Tax=Lymnaea stagnalis TaxID=6523 RepID=A0AAV2H534_LYMST
MDTLVRSSTFVHDDHEAYEEFARAVRSWSYNDDNESRGVQDICKILDALEEKLTASTKPEYKTRGWDQAQFMLKELLSVGGSLVRDNAVVIKDMRAAFNSFFVRLLDNKFNTLHFDIAFKCIEDHDLGLKDFIQEFDKLKLEKLLLVVCKDLKEEDCVEGRNFGDTYLQFVRKLLKETLSLSQVEDAFSTLLDFAVHLYLGCLQVQEDVYNRLVDTGKVVMECLKNPFSHYSDLEKIKSYIRKCSVVFKDPKFAPHKSAARYSKELMGKMMEALGKRNLLEDLYADAFDLVVAVTKCSYKEEGEEYIYDLLSAVTNFFRYTQAEGKPFSKNAETFTNIVKKFINVLEGMEMRFLIKPRFVYIVVDDALKLVYRNNKQMSRSWLEMLVPLYKRPCENTARACYTITSENKMLKWKENADFADQICELVESFQAPEIVDGLGKKEKEEIKEFLDYYKRSLEYFFDGLKKDKMIKSYSKRMMKLSLKFMATQHEVLFELAEAIAEKTELNIKEDKNDMIEAVKKFHELLKDEDRPWMTSWPLQRAANDFLNTAMEPFKDGKVFTDEEFIVFTSICQTCLQYDVVNPETGQFPSGYFSIFLNVIKPLLNWVQALNKMDVTAALVPDLIKCLDADDESVVMLTGVYLNMYGQASSGQKVVAPYLDKIITVYLEKENSQLLIAINEIYPSNPKALKDHFRALMQLFEDTGEPTLIIYLCQLFQKVAKKQAELFTANDMEILLTKARESINSQVMILQIVQELSKRCPEDMVGHLDLLLDHTAWSPMVSYFITDMLVSLALYQKDVAPKVLNYLFHNVKTSQDKSTLLTSFNALRLICFKHMDLMKPRRAELDAINITDPDAIGLKKMILDMIDGKSSEDVVKNLKKQEEELASLVGRVNETEEILTEIKEDVSKQGDQLNNVKTEVKEQGQRLDKVEVTVEETVAKVEEIDQKTLSHAPFWARDVSKLLNPTSDHDWRLLSKRLMYSNDDIRGWAQQADPCMAMLNEWYATHKTSEATLSIFSQLQEMNRLDAAIIVENAMKNAEAVVEDEAFEYASPPPIFLSYQWGHQAEVKLLKQHLEMAGYECWLDIGQMGGGDKLFEKIDSGIRAAKVILSCVTSKYSKSPNCNREVNLAVGLNKPIIPLLLEQCTWPPPGSMGPIFSEYLFIRFFQRAGEEVADQRYWSKDKFQELLMQLSMVGVAPKEHKVQPEYKNWWMPVVQEIKINKSKTYNGGIVSETGLSELDKKVRKASESPDVFISYQWGKQKNIIKLYERLTSLGLTCWLDIKQMGGGDSLYDKIDRGLRGCQVVLSCVTQKYALSANCRREVSLADALKKPLIPLLLEQRTWPPAGPMGMVLTQLLYINFSKDESVQMKWEGPEFDEMLKKIYENIPKALVTSKNQSVRSSDGIKVLKDQTPSSKEKQLSQNGTGTMNHGVVSPNFPHTAAREMPTSKVKSISSLLKPTSLKTRQTSPKSNPANSSLAPIKSPTKLEQKYQGNPLVSKSPTSSSLTASTQQSNGGKKPSQLKPVTLVKGSPSNAQKASLTAATKNVQLSPSSKQILKPLSPEQVTSPPVNQSSAVKPLTRSHPTKVLPVNNRPARLPPLGSAPSAQPTDKKEKQSLSFQSSGIARDSQSQNRKASK